MPLGTTWNDFIANSYAGQVNNFGVDEWGYVNDTLENTYGSLCYCGINPDYDVCSQIANMFQPTETIKPGTYHLH